MIDLDGVLVLTPLRPLLPELAAEIERLMAEAGADLPELLAGLHAERQRLYEERWQPPASRRDEPSTP